MSHGASHHPLSHPHHRRSHISTYHTDISCDITACHTGAPIIPYSTSHTSLLPPACVCRALESRAKVKAAEDLSGLAHLIPATSRLVLDPGSAPGAADTNVAVEYLQVPAVLRV